MFFHITDTIKNTPECSLYKPVEQRKHLLPYHFTLKPLKALYKPFSHFSKLKFAWH